MRAALVALLFLVACARGGQPSLPAEDRSVEATARALRVRLAEHPGDRAAHLQLARLELRAGQRGAALRHFERAARLGALRGDDRAALAGLLRDRAAQRLALGDGAAIADLDRAQRLDPTLHVDAALEREALAAAALTALRHSDARDRQRASRWLARLRDVADDDPRTALLAPEAAPLDRLGAAAAWAWQGRALRAGHDLLDRYYRRGGRDALVLSQWLDARLWWGGRAALPGLVELDELAAAGVDLCRIADEPDAAACAAVLGQRAQRGNEALQLWRRAESLGWRSARPEHAGAWLAIAWHGWLAGEAAVLDEAVRRRVDVDALAGAGAATVPAWARPTLLRIAGRPGPSAAALAEALERAAQLAPVERAIVMTEIGLQRGLEDGAAGEMDRLLDMAPVDAGAWLVALRAARAAGAFAREAKLLARAPAEVARAHLAAQHEWGPLAARAHGSAALLATARAERWRHAVAADVLADGRAEVERRWQQLGATTPTPAPMVVPLGMPDPIGVAAAVDRLAYADARALTALLAAYRRDPAAADRLAAQLVDAEPAIGARAPLVAELFARLGDSARALRWFERALEESPRDPSYLFATGVQAAASGDVPRAELHFIAAAAESGRPGDTSVAAARALLAIGQPLAALTAARRAAGLLAPGGETELLELVVAAATELGRDRDAAAADALLRQRRPVTPAPPKVSRPADAAGLRRHLAWNPADLEARIALLTAAPAGSAERRAAVADLVLFALGGTRAQADAAWAALIPALDDLGARALAAAARAELALPEVPPPPSLAVR